jgi:hypothetical protein
LKNRKSCVTDKILVVSILSLKNIHLVKKLLKHSEMKSTLKTLIVLAAFGVVSCSEAPKALDNAANAASSAVSSAASAATAVADSAAAKAAAMKDSVTAKAGAAGESIKSKTGEAMDKAGETVKKVGDKMEKAGEATKEAVKKVNH